MRTKLLTPMTTNARQITTMKYGLRIEKPAMCSHFGLLPLTETFTPLSLPGIA
jgi:hypothetical protein